MQNLQDDGRIRSPVGNVLDLGNPVAIPGTTVSINGTVYIQGGLYIGTNAQTLAIPAGSSAATNTTVTIVGTSWSSGISSGIVLFDTKVNGTLGTVAYTFNDLVRALKVAGVIAT